KRILTKSIEAVINATKIKSQEASSGIEGKFSSPKPPSIPEEASWLLIFVALMTASILFVRIRFSKN
ncbi:MAG TPA: hypothetical protein HA227_03700, partial [Candidatus Diapherotrites archaeon]|nr:hypothetical protein [Candidatus Diapherotrites archaeon]